MVSNTTTDGAPKVYTCPTCSRQFNKKANLKVHSRKHTGEKPYACSRPGCDRRFMWKSSVSFHEQNCLSGGRDGGSGRDSGRGASSVPKRHKMIHGTRDDHLIASTLNASMESPPRPHITNIQNPAVLPVDSVSPFAVQNDFRNNELLRQAVQTASSLAQNQHFLRLANANMHSQQALSMARHSAPLPMFSLGHQTTPALNAAKVTNGAARNAPLHAPSVDVTQSSPAMFSPVDAYDPTSKPFVAKSQPATVSAHYQSLPVPSPQQATSSLPPSFPTEANPLPAPSTILEKPIATAGRPPVIPPALPKPFFVAGKNGVSVESGAGVTKAEALTVTASAAKPPVMHSSKMKMPISMELDESDDEGADRIIGAQETFMRTGNIFTGFAPPPRCSPLPASSPIVGPGISPMPLSPLAPFSPLPPDSPAHNAPNPVHPPLNQPQRSSSWTSNAAQ